MFTRRILAVALSLVMILMLVGCGGKKTESGMVSHKDFVDLPEGWYLIMPRNLRYNGGHNGADVDIALPFALRGKHAKYYLAESDSWSKWTPDEILDQLIKIEDSIQYVKDWFGYENTPLIEVILLPEGFDESIVGFALYEIITGPGFVLRYNPDNALFLNTIVHESTHALTFLMGDDTDFPRFYSNGGSVNYLMEGLASTVASYYIMDRQEIRDLYANSLRSAIDRGERADFIMDYERFLGESFSEDTFDYIAYLHAYAIETILDMQNEGSSEYFMPYIRHYRTAASFVHYLLDIGTKEQFHEAYTNVYRMHLVYEKDMVDIYYDWLKFLGFDESSR